MKAVFAGESQGRVSGQYHPLRDRLSAPGTICAPPRGSRPCGYAPRPAPAPETSSNPLHSAEFVEDETLESLTCSDHIAHLAIASRFHKTTAATFCGLSAWYSGCGLFSRGREPLPPHSGPHVDNSRSVVMFFLDTCTQELTARGRSWRLLLASLFHSSSGREVFVATLVIAKSCSSAGYHVHDWLNETLPNNNYV